MTYLGQSFEKYPNFLGFFYFCKAMLPKKINSQFPSHLKYLTGYHLYSLNFSQDDIAIIIENFPPNKTHGKDNISVCMLEIVVLQFTNLQKWYLSNALKLVFFPLNGKNWYCSYSWKKKQTLIKLLSTIAVEKLLKDCYLRKCSMKCSGYSCINQLLSITHEIYESFDEGLEVRNVFLDISKAFGKVWYDGIIFNWTQIRTSRN